MSPPQQTEPDGNGSGDSAHSDSGSAAKPKNCKGWAELVDHLKLELGKSNARLGACQEALDKSHSDCEQRMTVLLAEIEKLKEDDIIRPPLDTGGGKVDSGDAGTWAGRPQPKPKESDKPVPTSYESSDGGGPTVVVDRKETQTEYVRVPATDPVGEAYKEALRRYTRANPQSQAAIAGIETMAGQILHGMKVKRRMGIGWDDNSAIIPGGNQTLQTVRSQNEV